MKVFFVASEALPYVKTGGLGDVTGSLPSALHRLGADVSLVLPFYAAVKAGNLSMEHVMTSTLAMGGRTLPFTVLRHHQTLFIQQDEFFLRDGLYGTREGDYPDNWLRFAFFSRAALETIIALGGADVIHVHDWQTSLLPLYLHVFHPDRHEKTLLTIHNIAYQGLFSPEILPDIGLPESVFTQDGLEFYGNVNYLKGGIVWADEVNTVSPTYAREIQTDEYSFGLHGILATRREHLSGILNGIDSSYWDPSTDGALPHMYSPSSLAGKVQDKESLLQETGLAAEPDRPLFVMVSRLVAQKGIDLMLEHIRPDDVAFHKSDGPWHGRHRNRDGSGGKGCRLSRTFRAEPEVRRGSGTPHVRRIGLLSHALAVRAMRPVADDCAPLWKRPCSTKNRWTEGHRSGCPSQDRDRERHQLRRRDTVRVP